MHCGCIVTPVSTLLHMTVSVEINNKTYMAFSVVLSPPDLLCLFQTYQPFMCCVAAAEIVYIPLGRSAQ